MSVVGFDLGNENCFIAVARAGGIETIANEYSQRSTPTYVAFNEKTRDLGVTAKNKQITNLKNTLFSFKRLIGKKYKDPIIQRELQYIPYETCSLPNGEVGFKVNYLNEQTVLTAQQVMGMMFTKLKEITEACLGNKIHDCVVSVPIYYTDVERRAILDSAEIAGLNVLKLMNEPTAVALAYGFYKQDLPEDKPKNVVFVDLGAASLQATACAFTNGKLKILGSSWNRNVGGRDFDNALVRYFVEDFKNRYKLDVLSNKRAVIRLMAECEKLKKQMSASSLDLPLNVECLMDDKDVTGRMNREDFENLSADLFQHIEFTLEKLLHDTNLKPGDIDSVQIVGGSSRIPAVKSLIEKVFNKPALTNSLNQDEAVARGCALQCAMLSRTLKVRDFSITDVQPYPVKLLFKDENETEIFPLFHPVPFSKLLTFFRTEPFAIEAHYSDPNISDSKLGSFTIMNVTPNPEGESTKVKVKARINIHGIFSISSATMLEKQPTPVEETVTPQTDNSKPDSQEVMDSENPPNGNLNQTDSNGKSTDKQENEKKELEQKKPKNIIKSVELPIKADVPSLSKDLINDLLEKEFKMIMQDKLEKEKADAKNAVEEYVYDFRGKLSAELENFVSDKEKEKIKKILEETENWLYDEGEDVQKSVYVQKLAFLKKHGDPVMFRYNEWEERPQSLDTLGQFLQLTHKAWQSHQAKEELWSHITQEDMLTIKKIWDEKEQWHGKWLSAISKLQKHQNPPVTVEEIRKAKKEIEDIVIPILSKPKPIPPTEETVNGETEPNTSEVSDSTKIPKENQSQDAKSPGQSNQDKMETD